MLPRLRQGDRDYAASGRSITESITGPPDKSLLSLPSAFSIGSTMLRKLFFRVDYQPTQLPVFVTFIGELILGD
jgi:hypothetical protein